SAGIAMATSLVSALSRRAVRKDTSMTGEITISGRVLPIGGLKEKILGAVRAGITRIVIPKDNEADLEDLPREVRERIEVSPVEDLAQALAETLRDTSLQEGRLFFGAGPETQTDRPHGRPPLPPGRSGAGVPVTSAPARLRLPRRHAPARPRRGAPGRRSSLSRTRSLATVSLRCAPSLMAASGRLRRRRGS